ncbi:MAG: hypothetical protein ABSH19_08415 [Opitutales bacterium]
MGPTKPPTASEYVVLAVFVSAIFIILGAVALIVAFLKSAQNHPVAAELAYLGWWSLGFGLLVAAGLWLTRKFTR